MFTGLIQAVGRLRERQPRGGDIRLWIDRLGAAGEGLQLGDSVSVSGACLTAVEFATDAFAADVSRETLDHTTLGTLAPGAAVNLEPALRLGDRLGGHLVTGHVDGVGRLREVRKDARSWRLAIEVPAALRRYLAAKGSVCVDGVSLTVNAVATDGFDVNIVPHTATHTTLGGYRPGQPVNLEVDMIARYLEALLQGRGPAGLDAAGLASAGFGATQD